MHRISNKLAACQAAETEAKSLGKRNENVIAGTVAEVLGKAARMDSSTGWDILNEILETACREAANPVIRNTPRQRGPFKAVAELQEVLPNLADTRFMAGDLAETGPQALRSPA